MRITFINPKHHPHSMNFHHCMDIVGVKYSHMPLSLPTHGSWLHLSSFCFFLSGFASACTGGVKIYHIIKEAFK